MMRANHKAKDLVAGFIGATVRMQTLTNPQAKQCALECVDKITEALTDYGSDSHELQNMDSEFRYWDEVKNEIRIMKI